jgi:hypothetical protein
MRHQRWNLAIFSLAALLSLLAPSRARAVEANVLGTANPNLAARADGYSCCSGDSTPLHAPTLVTGLNLTAGNVARFEVSGQVSYAGNPVSGNNPDGDEIFDMTNYGDGISAPLQVRANALVGLFLGPAPPTGAATPEQLSFATGLDFASVAPVVGQIFFIGDGLTSDTLVGEFDGEVQEFVIPDGATRLFLGVADGVGWYNNSGAFTVDVTSGPPSNRACADPIGTTAVTASDALFILNVAVGIETCALCTCDTDGSGSIAASDALRALLYAVGLPVPLECPTC